MQVRKLKSCFLHWNEIFLQHMTNVRIKYGLKLWHVKRLQFLMEILSPAFALSWRICKLKKINHYLEETISFCSFLLQSSPLHLLAYNNMSEYVPSFCVRRLFVKTGKNGRNTTTRSNTASSVNFHGQIVCCYHNPLAVHHFVSAEDKESAARTCLSNVPMLYILMIFFHLFCYWECMKLEFLKFQRNELLWQWSMKWPIRHFAKDCPLSVLIFVAPSPPCVKNPFNLDAKTIHYLYKRKTYISFPVSMDLLFF